MTPRDLKTVVECLLRAVMGTTMHEASPLQGCSHRALRRCVHSRMPMPARLNCSHRKVA